MDLSPLNWAHRYHRRAEFYLEKFKFQEAIVCHQRAADYLAEALKKTTCEKIRTSLLAQKEFHEAQEALLQKRRVSFVNQLEAQRLMRKEIIAKMTSQQDQVMNKPSEKLSRPTEEPNPSELQKEFNRMMEEHDSLLQYIIQKDKVEEEPKLNESTATTSTSDSLYKSGSKMAKDDKTKIEELQVVNEKLRQLVYQLLSDLEKTQKENAQLRSDNLRLQEENRNTHFGALTELPPLETPTLLY